MQVRSGGPLDAATSNTVFFVVSYILVEVSTPYKLQPLSSKVKVEAVGPSEASSFIPDYTAALPTLLCGCSDGHKNLLSCRRVLTGNRTSGYLLCRLSCRG